MDTGDSGMSGTPWRRLSLLPVGRLPTSLSVVAMCSLRVRRSRFGVLVHREQQVIEARAGVDLGAVEIVKCRDESFRESAEFGVCFL